MLRDGTQETQGTLFGLFPETLRLYQGTKTLPISLGSTAIGCITTFCDSLINKSHKFGHSLLSSYTIRSNGLFYVDTFRILVLQYKCVQYFWYIDWNK